MTRLKQVPSHKIVTQSTKVECLGCFVTGIERGGSGEGLFDRPIWRTEFQKSETDS